MVVSFVAEPVYEDGIPVVINLINGGFLFVLYSNDPDELYTFIPKFEDGVQEETLPS